MLGQEPTRALPGEAAIVRSTTARSGCGLLLAVLVFGGCASVSDVAGMASQQDLLELRTELARVQQTAARAKADADAAAAQVDRRLKERAAEEDRQLQALAQRVEALGSALTTLSGRVDELHTRMEALRQTRGATVPSPLPPTITARPAPSPPATAPPAPSVPAAPPPPAEPTPGSRPSTNPLQPQDIYQAAYIDFSKGSYPLAIAGFREFLRRFPDHQLAGAAQYWIGEAYFSIARGHLNAGQAEKATEALEQAVQEFRKVQANYARSDKTATALYKEALALLELKQPAVAQARLQYLVDNFPQAEEAPLARERLTALKPPVR